MKVIIVDDEIDVAENLYHKLLQIPQITNIELFTNPSAALEYVAVNPIDVVFLDIEMFEISGIEIARELKRLNVKVNIIFVTGYAKYAVDGFEVEASDYLLKPPSVERIILALERLREPVAPIQTTKLTVHTFGNFDVKKDGRSLHFNRSKSKEIFAYLIDRKGASVTARQIAAVLWAEKPFDRNLSKQISTCITELFKTLKESGCNNVVVKNKTGIAVNVNEIDCDYYNFLKGNSRAINTFTNEYMTNYSWSEFTLGILMLR